MGKHLHQAERLVHYRDEKGNLRTLTAYTSERLEYITKLLDKKHIIWWLRRVFRPA